MKVEFGVGPSRGEAKIAVAADTVSVSRDGALQSYEFTRVGSAIQLFSDGKTYDVSISHAVGGVFVVNVNGVTVTLDYIDERSRSRTASAKSPASSGEILSVMPGRVVKIIAKEGSAVTVGDSLLVLEAMKMENEIKAPCNGVVKKISVTQGQSVEMGAALLKIEPEKIDDVS